LFGGALAPEGNWIAPAWEFLTRSLDGFDWLRERYPELNAESEPRRSMAQFDLVLCLHNALIDHRSLAFFVLDNEAANDLALRLHGDDGLRLRLTEALDVTLEDFDARAPAGLEHARSFESSWASPAGVAAVLQQGRTAL
jgi:hypothetical protein